MFAGRLLDRVNTPLIYQVLLSENLIFSSVEERSFTHIQSAGTSFLTRWTTLQRVHLLCFSIRRSCIANKNLQKRTRED